MRVNYPFNFIQIFKIFTVLLNFILSARSSQLCHQYIYILILNIYCMNTCFSDNLLDIVSMPFNILSHDSHQGFNTSVMCLFDVHKKNDADDITMY